MPVQVLAEQHGATQLKERSLEFIGAKPGEVMATEGWLAPRAYPNAARGEGRWPLCAPRFRVCAHQQKQRRARSPPIDQDVNVTARSLLGSGGALRHTGLKKCAAVPMRRQQLGAHPDLLQELFALKARHARPKACRRRPCLLPHTTCACIYANTPSG